MPLANEFSVTSVSFENLRPTLLTGGAAMVEAGAWLRLPPECCRISAAIDCGLFDAGGGDCRGAGAAAGAAADTGASAGDADVVGLASELRSSLS